MGKFKRALVFVTFFLITFTSQAQITLDPVNTGPYSPGSSIAISFTSDANTCIAQNNIFELYLSDASGNFVSTTPIGTYNGFYSAFVNGTIPIGTPAGTGYRLRIKTTSPASVSTASTPFEIRAGTPVNAGVTSEGNIISNNPTTFGKCNSTQSTLDYIFSNTSNTNSATATITNLLTSETPVSLSFTTAGELKTFKAKQAHYLVFTTATGADGSIGTHAYFLVNNRAVTAFATTSGNTVCFPTGTFEYSVDVSETGIKANFPGSTYQITWGDDQVDTYTYCDIIQQQNKVKHSFSRSSCGVSFGSGANTAYNAFGVNVQLTSPFCGPIGTALSTTARVVTRPVNKFTFPPIICLGDEASFVNQSTKGQKPNETSNGCSENNVTYSWYVDGNPIATGKPIDFVFKHTFTTKGQHKVLLVSNSDGDCQADPVENTVCVQDPPKPAFTLSSKLICLSAATITANSSASILDNTCPNTPVYTWTVTPAAGVTFDKNAANPNFTFAQTGVYSIVLSIKTGTCEVSANAQEVVVNTSPQASLSKDNDLCARGDYTFGPNSDVTKTLSSGTVKPLADTYTWTVTGAGGYSFVSPSTPNSQYPTINFQDFGTYTVTLTHKNNCGEVTVSQKLNFTASPTASITATPTAVCYNDNINLEGKIENAISKTTFQWVGAGTFLPTDNLKTVYTPTLAERNAGVANIKLVVNTGITGTCAVITSDAAVVIYPKNTVSNPLPSLTQNICTGDFAVFTPQTNVPGSTFKWTAVNTAGTATGFSASGNGNINEAIVNTDAVQTATVEYTITPESNGCDGVPFKFTVNIAPRPVITAAVPEKTICHNNPAAIVINSNIPATFTWTSTATTGITGNTSNLVQGTAANSLNINDVLLNSAFNQGTVTYTITPYSSTGCKGKDIQVIVHVDPAVTPSNAGPNENICSANSYVLKGNKPDVGTGLWKVVSVHAQVPQFADATDAGTKVSNLVPGETYTFSWTITGTGKCAASSSEVTITVNEPTLPGTTATTTALVCQNSNTGVITLSGNRGTVKGWQSMTSGAAVWTDLPGINTGTTYTFKDLTLTTQFRAVVQNGGCTIEYSTPTTITVSPATTIAKAGNDQTLCASGTVLLEANPPAAGESGLWTKVSGTGNITIADPTSPKTEVTGLLSPQTYVFKWTITGNSPCGPSESQVNIRNNEGINQSISSNNTVVCNGQTATITGSTPTGGDEGNYQYLWELKEGSGAWTVIAGETSQNLSIQLSTTGTVIFRRTVKSGSCTSISNEFQITVQPPITKNTITADQTICSGKAPEILTGSTPEGADGQFLYQWQSSPDGNNWTNISSGIAKDYQPQSLTATTYYRRLVGTVQCSGTLQSTSNAIKVTVNPNAIAEFNWTSDKGCIPFKLDIHAVPYADRNNTYTWYADDVQIATGINFPEYILKTSNTSVTIKLVVSSLLGCSEAEFSHVFSTNQAVPASFTPLTSEGCDPLKITFVNTSILTAGATFKWDFGNGEQSDLANPAPVTFYASPSGKDSLYTVTLTATTTCGSNSVTATVFVKAKPIAVFSPSKTDGCSPMSVDFTNTSPGGTNKYYYDFGDGSPIVEKTDKSPVNHIYNTTKTQLFKATLTAVNDCGTDIKSYDIRVAPQNITPELVVDAKEKQGCAPWTVHFDNNSIGASRFTFDFGDGGTRNTVTTGTETYTFTKAGTYTVKMTAFNSCSEISTTETITVLPQPQVAFDADITLGCAGLAVQFRNHTQDGFSYSWDFGDGSPLSNEIAPIHTYTGDQEYYTVILTATNSLGCTQTISRNQYIHIVPPPVAKFNVSPSTVISIPDYTFRFEDESTNQPSSWLWTFGDQQSSTLQNPSHTYADTGKYTVTLKVINQQGCVSSTFKQVTIQGVPGYLYLPNAFMPGGSRPELRSFQAKGSGIKTWKLTVFNKWGQALWETSKLEEGRPVEGWDGTFSGSPAPQGVYFWKVDVEFINGTEWKGMSYDNSTPKRTGPIHLIR